MMTSHRRAVSLSFQSLDLAIGSTVETTATLYQRDRHQFHLLLTEPWVQEADDGVDTLGLDAVTPTGVTTSVKTPRLIWLELSPCRAVMTMQGNGSFSYRHMWGQGVYGISRYWLQQSSLQNIEQMRLQNYTRSLILDSAPIPRYLQVDYELWTGRLCLGRYMVNLDIEV